MGGWGRGVGSPSVCLLDSIFSLSLTFEQNASCPKAHVPQTTFHFVSPWWSAPVHSPGLDPLWPSEKFVISNGTFWKSYHRKAGFDVGLQRFAACALGTSEQLLVRLTK